jgi:hypothetical protein
MVGVVVHFEVGANTLVGWQRQIAAQGHRLGSQRENVGVCMGVPTKQQEMKSNKTVT